LFAFGCGDAPLEPDDGGSDGSSGDESSADESSDSSTTSPLDQGPDCAPADPSLALRLDTAAPGGTCVVVAPVGGQALSFECDGFEGMAVGGIFADVTPALPIDIAIGTAVTIEATQEMADYDDPLPHTSIFVRDAATNHLLVAAIDSFGTTWTSELFPLTLDPIEDACTSEPDESNCRTTERLMWNAQYAETIVPVGDGTRTQVGDYAVHIQRAADGSLLECLDVGTDFYEALIVRTQ
jgi:hypothetical protein